MARDSNKTVHVLKHVELQWYAMMKLHWCWNTEKHITQACHQLHGHRSLCISAAE